MTLSVISPINNEVYVTREHPTQSEIQIAVLSAKEAFAKWKVTPLEERIRIAKTSLDCIKAKKQVLAMELTYQMGRPIRFAPKEIDSYIYRANHMIQVAKSALHPIAISSDSDHSKIVRYIKKEPLGVVFVLAAWNYPYLIAVNSVIPALLAGNAVILKHSAQTPLVAERMVESFRDAGLPRGVFQYLHLSHRATESLIQNPGIDFVQFTGSVSSGQSVMGATSRRFIGSGLELGGCDAAYVRSDANLASTVANLVDGAFFNSGQSCCSIQRILVHASVYDHFVDLFTMETLKQYGKIGGPLNPETTLGPCVKVKAADELRELIKADIQAGARNLLASHELYLAFNKKGSAYMSPHVLVDVKAGMHIMKDELFGPVVAIKKVCSDEEAIAIINDNSFGLTASIWTHDNEAAAKIGDELDVGTVFQNKCDYVDPALAWVGVKDSGRGVTLSVLGYDQLTRPKSYYLSTQR